MQVALVIFKPSVLPELMFGAITGSNRHSSDIPQFPGPRAPGQASSSAKYYRDLATGPNRSVFSLGSDGPGVGPGPDTAASASSYSKKH